MEEAKIRHLEMIQGVVHRLANQAAWTRRFSLVFVATVTAGALVADQPLITFVSLVGVVCWWLLDAYYLAEERNFRALFDHIRVAPDNPDAPFTMKRPQIHTSRTVARSFTVLLFHLPLVGILLASGVWLCVTGTSGCS